VKAKVEIFVTRRTTVEYCFIVPKTTLAIFRQKCLFSGSTVLLWMQLVTATALLATDKVSAASLLYGEKYTVLTDNPVTE
jgi:hypothetical protein